MNLLPSIHKLIMLMKLPIAEGISPKIKLLLIIKYSSWVERFPKTFGNILLNWLFERIKFHKRLQLTRNLKKSNSSASLLPKLLSLISILSKRYKPPKLTETFPVKLFTSTFKSCSSEALDNEVGRDRQIGLKKFEAIGDGEGWGISLWEDFH